MSFAKLGLCKNHLWPGFPAQSKLRKIGCGASLAIPGKFRLQAALNLQKAEIHKNREHLEQGNSHYGEQLPNSRKTLQRLEGM